MARPTGNRPIESLGQHNIVEQNIPTMKLLFVPPKGEYPSIPYSAFPEMGNAVVRNMLVRNGKYESRMGTGIFGAYDSNKEVIHAVSLYVPSSRQRNTVRWVVDGPVEFYTPTGWQSCTGVVPPVTSGGDIITAGWGDSLLFCTGSGTIYSMSVTDQPFVVRVLTGAPNNIRHITTFGSRVIASSSGAELYWSAKLNSDDWSGLGSGFEDFRGAPTQLVDEQIACVPVSEATAYIIRTSSVWQVTLSSNFDKPFDFVRVVAADGCSHPATVAATTLGAVYYSAQREDVVFITPQYGPTQIGRAIKSKLVGMSHARGTYDPINDEYRLSIDNIVYVYSFRHSEWYEEEYPFSVRSHSFGQVVIPRSIDSNTAPIDSYTQTIDSMGGQVIGDGSLFSSFGFVAASQTGLVGIGRDAAAGGTLTGTTAVLESGLVLQESFQRSSAVELHIEYTASLDTSVIVDVFNGLTWEYVRTVTFAASALPRIRAVKIGFERSYTAIRLTAVDIADFAVIKGGITHLVGARVEDAR